MITIVVLIILAGISIGALTGDNGIITQTQNAKDQTEIADEKERIDLSTIGAVGKEPRGELKRDYFNDELTAHIGQEGKDYSLSESENAPFVVEYLDSKRSYLVDEDGNITGPLIAPEETEEPETGGSIDTMLYGVIEIKWLMGDTNFVSETANAPVIKSDLPTGTTMKLVHYDESGNPVDGTDYDYNENKWANAEVEIDGVKSYFVWIPRYAYRIVYFDTPDHQEAYRNGTSTEGIVGYSDSRGIVDVNGRKVDGVTSTTSINVGDYFRVHPAFTNEVDNGGWSEELPGIWVGKYESARSNASSTSSGSGTTIKVQPNVQSFRMGTIGNMFDYAKVYSTNLNSHMFKNSEWGAVAYLTESKYGRNGTEVTQNTNSSYLTANGDIVANANQSSTGNVTGIYDLSGGAYEYVSAYYSGSSSLSNGSSFADDSSDEFSTAYEGTTASSAYKPGDATYETSGWHGDSALFVNSVSPFFLRGGVRSNPSTNAGVFYFDRVVGSGGSDCGFRLCLAVK